MFDTDLLKDRVVLITGGGTGLGRAMGERFLSLGAKLAIIGRREDVLRDAAAAMQSQFGGQIFYMSCDVREPEQIEKMLDTVIERYGRINVLVNNAAGNFISPTERLSHRAALLTSTLIRP